MASHYHNESADPLKGLTLQEAARLYGCSVKTLRRLLDQGKIRAYRITDGGPRRITRAEIERAQQSQQQAAVVEAATLLHVSTVGQPFIQALEKHQNNNSNVQRSSLLLP